MRQQEIMYCAVEEYWCIRHRRKRFFCYYDPSGNRNSFSIYITLLEGNADMKEEAENSGIEIGIYTLADIGSDPHTGKNISAGQRVKEIHRCSKTC